MLSPNNTVDTCSSNYDDNSHKIVVVDENQPLAKSHENSSNHNTTTKGLLQDQHSNSKHHLSTKRTSKGALSINSNLVIPSSTYLPTNLSQDQATDCHTPNMEPHVQLAKFVNKIQRGKKRNSLCKNPHKMKALLLSQSTRRRGRGSFATEDQFTTTTTTTSTLNTLEGIEQSNDQDSKERQLTGSACDKFSRDSSPQTETASSSFSFERITTDAKSSDECYCSLLMDHDKDFEKIDQERTTDYFSIDSKNGSNQIVYSRSSQYPQQDQERIELEVDSYEQQQGQDDRDESLMLNEQDSEEDILMSDSFDQVNHESTLTGTIDQSQHHPYQQQPSLEIASASSFKSHHPSVCLSATCQEWLTHLLTNQERFLPLSSYLLLCCKDPQQNRSHVNISAKNRLILVDWICELVSYFGLVPETKYFCVNLLDRALSKFAQYGTGVQDLEITTRNFQALGICCFYITAKYFGRDDIRLMHLVGENDERAKKEILNLERLVLDVLGFELCSVTCVDFMFLFMQLMEEHVLTGDSNDMSMKKEELSQLIFYIGDVHLLCYDLLEFKPFLLALCSLILSLNQLGIDYKNLPIVRFLISIHVHHQENGQLSSNSSQESCEKNLNAFNDCLQRLRDYSERVCRVEENTSQKRDPYFVCQQHSQVVEMYFNSQPQQQDVKSSSPGFILTKEEFLNW
ncbi:hypothetical protein FDP41_001394 [Naegleria fowleri]|uniref:Cyclin-like domain-containing protein n=1 Tax=Naegleria fowleri TaxID=5763 RepID=A0A6A5BWM3_NAEFO|nr:uncharacterized protein FDP41_001394 [Naegleria fowleri]KAF0979726.1 hypothetical protein FDP41_001394 [Naegleria fowleri]CAG4716200.1 unnamed protein product [Naegleria fowleri]